MIQCHVFAQYVLINGMTRIVRHCTREYSVHVLSYVLNFGTRSRRFNAIYSVHHYHFDTSVQRGFRCKRGQKEKLTNLLMYLPSLILLGPSRIFLDIHRELRLSSRCGFKLRQNCDKTSIFSIEYCDKEIKRFLWYDVLRTSAGCK